MYTLLPSEEVSLRISCLQNQLQELKVDALLLTSNTNLLYLTGRVFSGYVYVSAQGEAYCFVKRPVELSGDGVFYIRKPEDIKSRLLDFGKKMPKTLLLETDIISYNEVMRLSAVFDQPILGNGSLFMRQIRMVKTPYEITVIRGSAKKHAEAYKQVPSLYEKGMTETDFAIRIETLFREQGNSGFVRIFGQSMEVHMGSLLAGENADVPSPYDFAMGGAGCDASLPCGAAGILIKPGMSVMVDFGFNYGGYITDVTRTYKVGEVSQLAEKAHQMSVDIQQMMMQEFKSQMDVSLLYDKAMEMVQKGGLDKYYMGHKQQVAFIGHGIGLELNELPVVTPRSKDRFLTGITFALEPKFVIPSVGAVGTENTFLVTDQGIELLTDCDQSLISIG